MLIAKAMGGVTRDEFFMSWDMKTAQEATKLLTKDQQKMVFKKIITVQQLAKKGGM